MSTFLAKSTNLFNNRYVHSCLELMILVEMRTINPSQKSVVLESPVKPSLNKQACTGLVLQKIQELLTHDTKLKLA